MIELPFYHEQLIYDAKVLWLEETGVTSLSGDVTECHENVKKYQ
jgi:hypothetical protein